MKSRLHRRINITIRLQWNPKAQRMPPQITLPLFFASIDTAARQTKGFLQMIKTLRLVGARGAMLAGAIVISASAFAQAPTNAQREAIRSACRSDYMAHCSSVPPGGMESLQCLQKNMASLSGSCKNAVNAVEAPAPAAAPAAKSETPAAAPKADTPAAAEPAKPASTAAPTAAATPKAAAAPLAKKPTDAQVAAIRSACRSDYPKVCAGVPTGGAPALQCLDKNKSKVSSSCQQALSAVGGGAAPAAAGASTSAPAASAAPAAAAPAAIALRPMRPREQLFVLRSACGGDVRSLCGGVAPGGGRIVQCLATNAASLSPACKDVLSQFRAQ
jgi:hypothetical protein